MSVEDYVTALRRELRDQSRSVRRLEAGSLREHLGELPDVALAALDPPDQYARAYRAERGLRTRRVRHWWRGVRWWVRACALVATFAAVAFAVVAGALVRYQPVAVSFFAGGPSVPAGGRHCLTPELSERTICTVQTGDEFFAAGTITNHSSFTVDLVRPSLDNYGLVEVNRFLGLPCARAMRFTAACPRVRLPVHIAPHSEIPLVIVYRIVGHCVVGGTGDSDWFGPGPIPLRFHFIGGTRTITVPTGIGSDFVFRFAGPCSGTEGVKLDPTRP